MSVPAGGPPEAQTQVCVRHPDRPTGLRCTRCDRPACPQCLREAPVGMQCVDCVSAGARSTPRARVRPSTPVVVPTLIAVNVAVFVLTVINAGSVADNASGSLFAATALAPVQVAGGGWWRLVTSGFLHIGLLHLLFNMIALWFIGRDVESVLGRLRFSVVYLVSLLGGSTAIMLLGSPASAVAGASGAVFGLMGALAVLLRRLRLSPGPAITMIGINVVISFVVPGISILGHLGGLVVGALVTAGFVYAPARSRVTTGFVVAGILVVVMLAAVAVRDLSLGVVYCESVLRCLVPG
jgi:membrane associated rhomboid family serine protease